MFGLGRRDAAAYALGSLALLGCDSSAGGNPIPPPPTMIVVDPRQFDDDVACVAAPGGMRVYVATLFDVEPENDASVFALPSSPPTACTTPVGFGYVEPGRKYRAEIDGYDVADVEPLTAGNRLLRRRSTADLIAPRWRASCGNPLPAGASGDGGDLSFLTGPAEAFLNAQVTVMGCTEFTDGADGSPLPFDTSIRVDLSVALGDLRCGNAPGEVTSYRVSPQDSSLEPAFASCDTPIEFGSLNAGQTYLFDVVAFEGTAVADRGDGGDAGQQGPSLGDASLSDAGQTDASPASSPADASAVSPAVDGSAQAPRWRTTCYQTALGEVQQTAQCEPLAPVP